MQVAQQLVWFYAPQVKIDSEGALKKICACSRLNCFLLFLPLAFSLQPLTFSLSSDPLQTVLTEIHLGQAGIELIVGKLQ